MNVKRELIEKILIEISDTKDTGSTFWLADKTLRELKTLLKK